MFYAIITPTTLEQPVVVQYLLRAEALAARYEFATIPNSTTVVLQKVDVPTYAPVYVIFTPVGSACRTVERYDFAYEAVNRCDGLIEDGITDAVLAVEVVEVDTYAPLAADLVHKGYSHGFVFKAADESDVSSFYAAVEFCRAQFGSLSGKAQPRWLYRYPWFFFKRAEDATKFSKRWL